MIIKANNKLYNCDGWREISREDEWVTISFFKTFEVDGETETFEHNIEIIDEDVYYDLQYRHEEWDYKDVRQIKYRAERIAYDILMKEVIKGTEFIDLDTLIDQEKLCKDAEEAFAKEWEEDDEYTQCESNP